MFFLPRFCAGTPEGQSLMTNGMDIHIFPSCPVFLGPRFPNQQMLPADRLNELAFLSHCSYWEPLPAWLHISGWSKFGIKPCKMRPSFYLFDFIYSVWISSSLLHWPPKMDYCWRDHLLWMPILWSKYFSIFFSLVSVIKYANWPLSVYASSKARWHCYPIWLW